MISIALFISVDNKVGTKYYSEMNPIEQELQYLKKDELSGQMFDDKLDLAYAVIDGIQARGEKGNYSTESFKFYSNQTA